MLFVRAWLRKDHGSAASTSAPPGVAARAPKMPPAQTRLVAAVLTTASLHDRSCLAASFRLHDAFQRRSLAAEGDLHAALDDSRRATTALCAALEPAARIGTHHLLPFARQLVNTRAIEDLEGADRDAFLRPLFENAGMVDAFVPAMVGAGGATHEVGGTVNEEATGGASLAGDGRANWKLYQHTPAEIRGSLELLPEDEPV